jgi:hypothetical protein
VRAHHIKCNHRPEPFAAGLHHRRPVLTPGSSFSSRHKHTLAYPTTSILLVLGAISAYTFHLLGRLTAVAGKESKDDEHDDVRVTSIGQLWDREVGTSTSWLVSLVVMITCYGTCLRTRSRWATPSAVSP